MDAPLRRPRANKARAATRLRRSALVVHRYVGLVMTTFLVVAGLTGALLAYYAELDAFVSPSLLRAAPERAGAPLLDPFELQERAQKQLPAGEGDLEVDFEPEPGRAVSTWVQTEPEKYREFFVNPYTGKVLGSREWGNLSEGSKNLMPFVYRLHYSLALGEVGTFLFGVVALLWTFDCFVGAYLTLPASAPAGAARGGATWLRRWLPAWRLKTSKLFSLVFTWHRASGLWIWASLLVFAWSAVGLNLRQVYAPVMRTLWGLTPSAHDSLPHLEKPYPKPRFTLKQAHVVGKRLMAEQASARGFQVLREAGLGYHADQGVFEYRVRSSLDITRPYPRTSVYFDSQQGRLVGFDAARGISTGNTITSWLNGLHFGQVFGAWYSAFVSLMGLGVVALSVTGAWIWLKKRRSRERSG